MSRIILFNADDWGLSRQIHESITGLHRAGALDAAGIMMGQPFTAQAASYAASHPGFLTGIHLFASDRDCKPLSARNWPFLWPEDFWVNTAVHLPAVEGLILAEVDAQLAAWKDTGLPLRFVNSHFHFHANHRLFHRIAEAILRHFPRFDGWIRLGDSRPMTGGLRGVLDPLMDLIESGAFTRDWRGRNNDSLLGIDRTFANSAADVAGACGKLGDGFHEFFFHPGRSWKLTESGSDHAALLELARLLPASVRNVALLLPGHLAPNHTAAFVAPAFFSQHAEPISTQSTHSMHTLNLPELDGGVEILAATPPAPFAFKAKMSIDGDGSPRAYHPDNTGLDHIDNAGRPGNWWGIVTRNGRPDGTPVVQTAEDPCPGYYVSATALVDPSVSNPHKPARYVDSEKIPYVVLPRGGGSGARLGDFATAVHLENGRVSHAIYADIGPRNQYGEGSMALAGALGLSPNPRRGGTSSRIIAYVFYPLSGNGRPRTTEEIEREGARLFEQWGGMDRVRELFANGGGGAGFGPSGLEILSEQAPDLSTIDGRIRAAEEALDLEALQSLRDSVLEHSELQQEEGEMAPRVEIFPDESFFEALGLSPAIAALDVGGMLGVVNRIVHAERWVRFVLDKRNRPHLPVIVAEGDSWFLHPLIHETLDCLREDSYNIRSLAAAGDTVENMLSSEQWLGPLAEEGAHAFLFSGGGNDFLGGGRIDGLVRREDTSKHPEQLVIAAEVDRLLGLITGQYTRMLRRLRGDRPWVKVFSHGYDYVARVDKGPWIWPYLERKGYSRERAVAVTAVLLDRFNQRMSALESREPNFRFISMIGTAGTNPSDWDDAIHPKSGGFRTVAGRFHLALNDFFHPSPALSEAAALTATPGWDGGEYDPTPDVDEASAMDAPPAHGAMDAAPKASRSPIGAGVVSWVNNHRNNPDYGHLPEAALGAEFELTPELLQRAVELGFYQPHFTADGHLVVAIRGAALPIGQSVLHRSSVSLIEQKPDHRTCRCVIAVWHRNKGRISAFRASTVPNCGSVASAHNRYNGHGGKHANLLPTGCYELCVGTHYGSATVPTVLRLGTGPEPANALEVTVLRNSNDGVYGTLDFWDTCKPADNIHPAFRAASADFSSQGCLTIPGSFANGDHSGLWALFRETAGFDGSEHRGTRYDLLLTTGMELAAISINAGNPQRLSHGSTGPEVAALQTALGMTPDAVFGPLTKKRLAQAEATANGGAATGIYSRETQSLLGFSIL